MGGSRVGFDPLFRQLEMDQRSDEPLLGTVVDVALNSLTGLVGSRDRARSGGDEIGAGFRVGDADGR